MTRTTPALGRAACAAATAFAVSCGSGSPTEPSAPVTPMTVFVVVLPNPVIGPGDNVPVIGLAAASVSAPGVAVTTQMRLESSNVAVLRVEGSHVIGVAPGEADVRGTFQGLSDTKRMRVFAPSEISRLVLYGTGGSNPCWPNDWLGLGVDGVLDDGTRVGNAASVVWRSTATAVAWVDVTGRVTCQSPGVATIEGSYQGKMVSTQVTVRTPEDAFELRGVSIRGEWKRGVTVTIGNSGFYVLQSAASGQIIQTITTGDGTLLGSSVFPVGLGSGEWHLDTRVTVPLNATSVCTQIVFRIDGSYRTVGTPVLECPPIS